MIRVYIGIALCLALAAGGWWLHHSGYASGQAACEAAHLAAQSQARQDHAKAQAQAARIQTHITHTGAVQVADSVEASHETVRYITRVVHDHPAPAQCVARHDSVQRLQTAVRQANAAAGGLRSHDPGQAASADP